MSFFKPQISSPLNFALSFSVMIHNSYEIFSPKRMLWRKRALQCTTFQTFECSKFTQFLMLFFKPQSQSLFKFYTTVQCHERELLCVFSSNLIYNLEKNRPSKWSFGTFEWKFTKFLMSYLKLEVSFSLNVASLFSVKRDNSSVIF